MKMVNELMCRVCDTKIMTAGVSEMTDGRNTFALCDGCRPMVVTFYHVYHNLPKAVDEARQARMGSLGIAPSESLEDK